ncbi:MAG: diacylglycerol kinase [Candidatus Omnitrophota bacterium]
MNLSKRSGKFQNKGFFSSVDAALEGIIHTLKTERNMRLHFFVAFLVLIGGIYLNFNAVEFMLLCFAVTFVLVAEMINTVIEHAVDLISGEYHPTVKIVKDISAGAVFVSSINALVVGYLLLLRHALGRVVTVFHIIKQSPWHVTLIVLLVVVGLVLLIKILRKEKHLLRGGMPSGHSAVAFAIWVIISLIAENVLISFLSLFMALGIAKSRMVGRIHTLGQVVLGSVLGALITLFIFQLIG